MSRCISATAKRIKVPVKYTNSRIAGIEDFSKQSLFIRRAVKGSAPFALQTGSVFIRLGRTAQKQRLTAIQSSHTKSCEQLDRYVANLWIRTSHNRSATSHSAEHQVRLQSALQPLSCLAQARPARCTAKICSFHYSIMWFFLKCSKVPSKIPVCSPQGRHV